MQPMQSQKTEIQHFLKCCSFTLLSHLHSRQPPFLHHPSVIEASTEAIYHSNSATDKYAEYKWSDGQLLLKILMKSIRTE